MSTTTPLTIPKIRFTLHLDVPVPTALDFHTFWVKYLQSGPVGALANAMAPGDTQLTLAAAPNAQPADPVPNGAGLTAVYCDGEVALVTASDGATLSLVRAPNPPLDFLLTMPNQTHAAGSTVYGLKYPSPHHMLVFEGLWPFTQRVNSTLGLHSETYNIGISGSISAAPTS